MSFDYSTSGLPENNKWKIAAAICNQWLNDNMSMFGPERIVNFMHNQPIAAAKRVMDNCDDSSEETVTLLLLGPAKGALIANDEVEAVARHIFGDRTVELLKTLMDPADAVDADMTRDANRIYIAEAVSAMSDQMIGRARIDKHHQVRWNMLNEFEKTFATLKGADPKLDVVFEDAAKKSREALEALDKAAPAVKKAPKPPKM